jgi:transcriptional regulator with XRE-family HTH domain
MTKGMHKPTMSDTLRAAVRDSGLSQYEISHATGILATSLGRFMRGETSLRLDKADALAEFFGLELVEKRKAK